MKLLIAVPSKGRADTITKRTMRWLNFTNYHVCVFVEPQEYKKYSEVLVGNFIKQKLLIDIKKNDGGLSYAKSYIKKYAEENGYDLVFKMDDDIMRFSGRGKNKPDEDMIIDFCKMVDASLEVMHKNSDIGAICFGYRNELFDVRKWTTVNARTQTCYIVRTELLHSGFNTMEDFAQFIYIRSKNKITIKYGLLGIDCAGVGTERGGLQMFNRDEQFREEVEKLKQLYPPIRFKKVAGKSWQYEPVLKGEFFGTKKI